MQKDYKITRLKLNCLKNIGVETNTEYTLTLHGKYFNHIDYLRIGSMHTLRIPTKRAFFPIWL